MLVLKLFLALLGSPTMSVAPDVEDCPCCDPSEECPFGP
jgi:hypothetical protein